MLPEDRRRFRKTLRDFMEAEVAPRVRSRPETSLTYEEAIEYLETLGEIGVGPAGEGGMAAFEDPLTYAVEAEEIARVWPSLNMLVTGCFPVEFLRWCSDGTRDAYAGDLQDGTVIGCFAVTEPGSGSDTIHPETTARREGDHYVLNGEKTWVSNAPIADMAVVVAHDVEEDERDFFVVDRRTSDFETRGMNKLGWRGSPTGQMFFDDCRIPVEHKSINILQRFYEEDPETAAGLLEDGLLSGENPLGAIFSFLRTGMGAMATDISQAALEAALEYSTQRETFGKPIARHQLIQDKLYTIKRNVETSRRMVHHAADLLERGEDAARRTASLAKAHATEKCVESADEAVQVHGANGLSTEYPVERYLRDARTMTVPDGTTEIQKLIVGYELTGEPAY